MSKTSERNLLLFTTVNSIWAVVMGLIGPFYVVYVEKLAGGGLDRLGTAFGIMVAIQSITTYYAGRFSDRLGRTYFLFVTTYCDASVLFLYTVVTETYQIYILQVLLGITNGVLKTVITTLLGDLTHKERRGAMVGRFNAIVSLASTVGLFAGGHAANIYGLKALFRFAAVCVALSSVFLFFIREDISEGREKETGME